METKEFTLETIVQRCKKNYINILPHNITKKHDHDKHNLERTPPKKEFSKSQISQMLVQLNSIIQLLTQNYIMAQDKQVKARCYKLIKELRNRMLVDLDHFDGLIYKKSNQKLAQHKVNYSDMLGLHRMDINVEMVPQVSIYQDPLLCYLFHPYVHAQIFKNQVNFNIYHSVEIIQRHVPVFNKYLVPILEEGEKTRSKFTRVDDRILLHAIINFGYKNSKLIKGLYFKDREEEQIRNRIKNLCAKPSNHPVRIWRIEEDTQMTDAEMKKLVKIFEDLGPRWKVIARYYGLKTHTYFENRYNPNYKFQKENPNTGENKFMLRFRQFQEEMRIFNQPEQLYIVNGSNFDNISDDGDEWGGDHTEMIDIDMEVEVQVSSEQEHNPGQLKHQEKLKHFDFKQLLIPKSKQNTSPPKTQQNKKKKKADREVQKEIAMDIEREILSMKRKQNHKQYNMGGDIELDSLYDMEIEMDVQEYEGNQEYYRVINGQIFRFEEL